MKKRTKTDRTFVIDRKTFNNLIKLVRELDQKTMRDGSKIRSFDLIHRIRKILDLENHILTAIYGIDLKNKKVQKTES